MNAFLDIMVKGGVVNYFILALYIPWFVLLLERVFYFAFTRGKKDYFEVLDEHLQNNQTNEFCELKKDAFITPLLKSYLRNREKPVGLLGTVLEDSGEFIITKLERGLWILRELGSIAPLIGLFGTVVGLIQAFATIADMGSAVEVSDLAAGIWQAMITTANGLILAILCFFSYHLLEQSLTRREKQMSHLIAVLDLHFGIQRENFSGEFQTTQSKKAGPDNEIH